MVLNVADVSQCLGCINAYTPDINWAIIRKKNYSDMNVVEQCGLAALNGNQISSLFRKTCNEKEQIIHVYNAIGQV